MTEEERGLFNELQDEIGELKRLLAATDGTAESKVDITDLYMNILQSLLNSHIATEGMATDCQQSMPRTVVGR